MKLIVGDCGSGKTKEILKLSSKTRIPVLCESESRKTRLLEKARGYDLNIPMPLVFSDDLSNISEVYVDDPARLLEAMLNVSLKGISINVSNNDVINLN